MMNTDPLDSEIDIKRLFREGERGKYAERYREEQFLVPLAPDVREKFPTADSVNEALRLVIQISKISKREK